MSKKVSNRFFQRLVLALWAALLGTSDAAALEHTKVMPKGVRGLNLRSVDTQIEYQTNDAGEARPLAEPLAKSLTFGKIARDEDPLRAKELRAFLLDNGFQESDAVGHFGADLNGRVNVVAGIMSYGLSDTLTLAVAVPYYRAATSVGVGFRPNETARAFLAALSRPETNETVSAREAAHKLNNAVDELNGKLRNNGYAALTDWQEQGVGDITVAAKQRFFANSQLASSYTAGVVLPSGRRDDPDILTDVGFGDGQTDTFLQGAVDEFLTKDLFLNQYAQYTVQWPGRKAIRPITAEEEIVAAVEQVPFKLGDKLDAGASIQYQPNFGLVTGLGYKYYRKFGDVYRELAVETKSELKKNTHQSAHSGEASLGYSTLPLYLAGSFAVPFEMTVSYTRQFTSINMPVTDLAQLDVNLFF